MPSSSSPGVQGATRRVKCLLRGQRWTALLSLLRRSRGGGPALPPPRFGISFSFLGSRQARADGPVYSGSSILCLIFSSFPSSAYPVSFLLTYTLFLWFDYDICLRYLGNTHLYIDLYLWDRLPQLSRYWLSRVPSLATLLSCSSTPTYGT